MRASHGSPSFNDLEAKAHWFSSRPKQSCAKISQEEQNMSSLIVNKYTVCLYVQGLGQGNTFFSNTINLITSSCPAKHIDFNISIDMVGFDCTTNQFWNPSTADIFNQITASLVNISLANPNKIIHARLGLNVDEAGFNYDLITNQKTKLLYVIDRIKNLSNAVRIILIGHSQGGLVNLEATIERPNQIERLISLSTPYSPVYAAALFDQVNEIREVYNTIAFAFNGQTYGLSPYFSVCVDTLASESYFNSLKTRWSALPYRPHLLAICGISSRIKTNGPLRPFFHGMEVTWEFTDDYRASDGLVSIQEQNAVPNAQIVNLYDDSIPCISSSLFLNTPCANSYSGTCISTCPLPFLDPSQIAITFLQHPNSYKDDALNAAEQAMNNQPFSGPDYVRPIYDAFIGRFSHARICTSAEAIQLIRGKLES